MKKDKARQIAKEVLEQVGGKDNVSKVLHCQTRLRFNLKDESVVVDEKIEEIKGVLGIVRAGGQIQIVVGPEVKDVYSELCDLANFENKDVDPVAKQKEKSLLNQLEMESLMPFQDVWDRPFQQLLLLHSLKC